MNENRKTSSFSYFDNNRRFQLEFRFLNENYAIDSFSSNRKVKRMVFLEGNISVNNKFCSKSKIQKLNYSEFRFAWIWELNYYPMDNNEESLRIKTMYLKKRRYISSVFQIRKRFRFSNSSERYWKVKAFSFVISISLIEENSTPRICLYRENTLSSRWEGYRRKWTFRPKYFYHFCRKANLVTKDQIH